MPGACDGGIETHLHAGARLYSPVEAQTRRRTLKTGIVDPVTDAIGGVEGHIALPYQKSVLFTAPAVQPSGPRSCQRTGYVGAALDPFPGFKEPRFRAGADRVRSHKETEKRVRRSGIGPDSELKDFVLI